MLEVIFSVVIPFIGTILGASLVFFVKGKMSTNVQKAFSGFAAGVMIAAAFWSLIIPSFEASSNMGKLSFIPVVIGLWLGFMFLMLLDKVIPHMHIDSGDIEGPSCNLKKSTMTALAVALHNLPEGIAVGVVLASPTEPWGSGKCRTTAVLSTTPLPTSVTRSPSSCVTSTATVLLIC